MKFDLIYASFAVAVAMTTLSFAQEPANGVPPPRGERGPRAFMQAPGMQNGIIFYRMLERPEFISKLGLPEEKVKALQEGFKKVADEEAELMKQRSELLKKNSELIAEFMSDRTKTAEVLETSFAELEAIQVKMSKLTVQRMIIIRDNLDEEQIKQARESVKTQFEERRKERMQRFNGEQRANGERPRRFGGGFEKPKAEPAPEAAPAAAPAAPAEQK